MKTKVLFVSSGNTSDGLPIINIRNQATSIINEGVSVRFFTVKGHGVLGYLKNIAPLAKIIREKNIKLIHAHYSLSGYLTIFSIFFNFFFFKAKPSLVVSLMGSDIQLKKKGMFLLKYFIRHFWDVTIVKSKYMYDEIELPKIKIITNGVDLDKIKNSSNFDCDNDFVLFGSDPLRYSKNFKLAEDSFKKVKMSNSLFANIKFKVIWGVPHNELIDYINRAKVFLLSSHYEGASIIIKEAMACNCPIVSTNVGDVKWVVGDTKGCYIVENSITDVANGINEAFMFAMTHGKTNGRERIKLLELDSKSVAKRIIKVYENIS